MPAAFPFPVLRIFWPVTAILGLALCAPLLAMLVAALPPSASTPSDFMTFWAAARLVWQGEAAAAYNSAAVTAAAGIGSTQLLASFYPPPYLLVTAPLGALPFGTAYMVFVAPGLLLLFTATVLAFAGQALIAALLVIGFGGFWQILHYGQNSGWVALLFVLAYLSIRQNRGQGGVALGLAVIKPHLGVLAPLHLLLARRWLMFALAALTVCGLLLVSTLVLGADIWPAYVQSAQAVMQRLRDFDMANTLAPISLYAGLRRCGVAYAPAMLAHLAFAAVVLVLWLASVKRLCAASSFALLPLATLLLLPHAYAYDVAILLLPVLAIALTDELRPRHWLLWLPCAALYLCSPWFVVINSVFALGAFPLLGFATLLATGLGAQKKAPV